MDCKKIGNLIYELRKSKNMTQKQVANLMNISDKTISKWGSGLLLRLLSLENTNGQSELSKLILIGAASDLTNKGNITEMVAGLELLKYNIPTQRHELYYWQNLSRGAQAEVDYVIVKENKVVPIEIKSGTSGSMKSMYQFLMDKNLEYGIRSSLENFNVMNKIEIIPLYALSNIFLS